MLNDFSQSEAVIRGEFLAMLFAWQSPSVLYRAKIFPDGNAWCCLYGENIQEGVCAFGATPAEAVRNFDWYVWHGRPVPEAK